MKLTMAEKIKVILGRQNLTIADLAEKLGQSRQNFTNKLARDNFSEKELHDIADKLGCTFEGSFVFPNGDKI